MLSFKLSKIVSRFSFSECLWMQYIWQFDGELWARIWRPRVYTRSAQNVCQRQVTKLWPNSAFLVSIEAWSVGSPSQWHNASQKTTTWIPCIPPDFLKIFQGSLVIQRIQLRLRSVKWIFMCNKPSGSVHFPRKAKTRAERLRLTRGPGR